MRKIVSILAVALLIVMLGAAVSATETAEKTQIVVNTVEAAAGDEVILEVSMINCPEYGIGNAWFEVEFDANGLEPNWQEVKSGRDTFTTIVIADAEGIMYDGIGNGTKFVCAAAYPRTGDGVLFRIHLKVKADAAPGSYEVKVNVIELQDDLFESVDPEVVNGSVNIACTHVQTEVKTENVVESTCTVAGSHDEVTYCVYCGFEMDRKTVTHELAPHTAGETVIENEVAATCQAVGSYDEVVYCSVCNEEMSRETKTTDKLEHTGGEVVIENEVAATCQDKGSYDQVVYCTVCHEELSRVTVETDMVAHTDADAVKENVENANCVTKGSYDLVVYCSVCGTEMSREHVEGEYGDHGEVEVKIENEVPAVDCKTPATYDEVTYCTLCGEELSRETKTGEVGEHTLVETVVAEPTCCDDGKKVTTCSVCGETISEEVLPATGEHDLAYLDNEDGKTHSVICVNTSKVLDPAELHTYGDLVEDTENPGWKYQVCDRCGYIHREEPGQTGDNAMVAVAMATVAMMGIAVVATKKKEF